MSFSQTSQGLESYLPVYDVIPEEWEEARDFIVEQLKKISNAVNVRDIGWYLNQELLSGKSFIPTQVNPLQYRSVFRQVYSAGPIVGGTPLTFPHGINFNSNFSLVQLFASVTDTGTLVAQPVPNGTDTISMDARDITISTTASYDIVYVVCEYLLES